MNASSAGRPPLLIFHINDSTDDQVLLQAAANAAGVPIEWHVADSAEGGISYLRSLVELSPKYPVCWPGLVVLELMLQGASGLKALEYIRTTPELRTLPVAVLTGGTNPATRQEADRLGFNSYHEKPLQFRRHHPAGRTPLRHVERRESCSPAARTSSQPRFWPKDVAELNGFLLACPAAIAYEAQLPPQRLAVAFRVEIRVLAIGDCQFAIPALPPPPNASMPLALWPGRPTAQGAFPLLPSAICHLAT